MKAFASFIVLIATILGSAAAGTVNFANSSSTLISVHGVPMPPSSVQEYVFAVFLAPSNTVSQPGLTPSFADPVFQLAAGYTTNHPTAAGRLVPRDFLDVGSVAGYSSWDFVDFVVRGWSANLGYTWTEALANWNDGDPLVPNWAIGSSTIGDNLILGGGPVPRTTLFGTFDPIQVRGFHLIPEPSGIALVSLGAASVLLFLRRKQSGDYSHRPERERIHL